MPHDSDGALDPTAEPAAHAMRERGDEVAALEARLVATESELASMLDLEVALASALEERDTARAELDVVRAERDVARTDAAELRTSTSWRATAPARWLSARVRRVPYV